MYANQVLVKSYQIICCKFVAKIVILSKNKRKARDLSFIDKTYQSHAFHK